MKVEYDKCELKLKEQEMISLRRLNEIKKLELELDLCRSQQHTEAQLINENKQLKNTIERLKLKSDKHLESMMIILTQNYQKNIDVIKIHLNNILQVIGDCVKKCKGSKIPYKKELCKEIEQNNMPDIKPVEEIKLLKDKIIELNEVISREKMQNRKLAQNTKKCIQECRRLQSELVKVKTECTNPKKDNEVALNTIEKLQIRNQQLE